MRKIFIIFLGFFLISAFAFSSFAEGLKIGYVDTIEVFNQYQRTIDQEERLDVEKDKVQNRLEEKERQIRETQRRLEVLREDQREEEIEKLQGQMEEYRALRQKELTGVQRKRDQMMREIVEDIDQAIKDYAHQNNYDFIINGNSVLYGPAAGDLTAQILEIINQEYKR